MFVQVVMPMAVMEETAALAASATTLRCLAMPKWTHARKASAVIVAMLSIRHTCSTGPTVTKRTGERAVQSWPVMTPAAEPSTTIDKLPHARTADAVIWELWMMSEMFVAVLLSMAVMEEKAVLADAVVV